MSSFSRLLSTISKKVVKPFSPTPSTQKIHKLSLLDQCMGNFYMPLVLFYPKHQLEQGPKQLSKLLETSFSKVLTYHQPWAGSLRDNATIHCDGTGAEFFEVEVNCPMNQIVHRPDLTFPPGLPWKNVPHVNDGGRLSVAQLSHFDCGGIAISVCMSHKVGDARSAFSFLKDWATLTREQSNDQLSCPSNSNDQLSCPSYYVQDSLMPSLPDGPLKFPVVVEPNGEESIEFEKRFFLSESNIRALKALIVDDPSSIVQNPTTTEVVSAIVYKCAAIAGANTSNGNNDSSSQMVFVSDLRKTIPPSIKSTSTIGNILTTFSTPTYNLEDLRLPKLVADIRKSKHELSTRDNFNENRWVSEMIEYANKINTGTEYELSYRRESSSHDVYRCSSVCNIPFQDLDFGWGRPTRASIASTPFNNMIYLMNTQDQNRGIEVFINLDQQQMSIFEQDKEFLQFASPVGDNNFHEDKEKLCCL
ncbi:acyltransferase Pun1-like [Solanum lycopersicum]|uniref:Acylsugar acyltransferase 3 n=1 Tax=Solanum lycopersicum TaxID=4081 RepID=A0A3Q7IZV2_SOLLC|nr:acylsugar acyltransferase 3-like [Solanum lycopersicum]